MEINKQTMENIRNKFYDFEKEGDLEVRLNEYIESGGFDIIYKEKKLVSYIEENDLFKKKTFDIASQFNVSDIDRLHLYMSYLNDARNLIIKMIYKTDGHIKYSFRDEFVSIGIDAIAGSIKKDINNIFANFKFNYNLKNEKYISGYKQIGEPNFLFINPDFFCDADLEKYIIKLIEIYEEINDNKENNNGENYTIETKVEIPSPPLSEYEIEAINAISYEYKRFKNDYSILKRLGYITLNNNKLFWTKDKVTLTEYFGNQIPKKYDLKKNETPYLKWEVIEKFFDQEALAQAWRDRNYEFPSNDYNILLECSEFNPPLNKERPIKKN